MSCRTLWVPGTEGLYVRGTDGPGRGTDGPATGTEGAERGTGPLLIARRPVQVQTLGTEKTTLTFVSINFLESQSGRGQKFVARKVHVGNFLCFFTVQRVLA